MRDNYLFSEHDLNRVMDAQKQMISAEIDEIDADRLLNTTTDSWVTYFQSKAKLAVPVLDEQGITVDKGEGRVDVSQDQGRYIRDRSRPFYLQGTEVKVFVPFEGDGNLFKCAPSTRSSITPEGQIHGQEIVIPYTRLDHDGDALKKDIDRDLGRIKQHLEWIAADLAPYNTSIPGLVRERVERRREKLRKDQGLVAGLGFPVRRRPDAPQTFVAPTVRRKTPAAPPSRRTQPGPPEPVLAIEEYEHILKVISNMVAVMERSPKAFTGMKEEDLRQHFLVQLNGQYEGQATGETFNFEGKTDVLIRSEGRNIFIAECKFWDGPESVTRAINQLLGYASWRDTKTALLLFNRGKNLTSVVQKMREAARAHERVLRELVFPSETGLRIVLHHKNDRERELILTVLVFDVPA